MKEPSGITTKEFISPDIAQQMMLRLDVQRSLRNSRVAQYAADMSSGNWDFNGAPIVIDNLGNIVDGQHRLTAVVASGIGQWFNVCKGIDHKSVLTIDNNAVRTSADALQFLGYKNAKSLSSICSMVYAYKNNHWPFNNRITTCSRTTAHQLSDLLSEHPEIQSITNFTRNYSTANKLCGFGRLGFILWMVRQKYQEKSSAFIEDMELGAGLDRGNPVLTFRNTITGLRASVRAEIIDRRTHLAYLIKTWNAYKNGYELKLLRFSRSENMPTVDTL